MLVLAAAVALSLLLVSGARTRSAARFSRDLGNLRQIGQWTFAYAADSEGRIPTLSEAPNSQWPILHPVAGQPLANAARHAADIIRRRTGREDFPVITGWIPFLLYNHLPLVDYLGLGLPQRRWVASGDVNRMNWTDDPVGKHDVNFWQPYQQPVGGVPGQPVGDADKRWPYSSSFNVPPAWYDVGQSDWSAGSSRTYQGGAYNNFVIPGAAQFEAALLSDVAFPSAKVLLHDFGDWYHAGTARFFGRVGESDAGARIAMLLADGAAAANATGDANPGWDARTPAGPLPAQFTYAPQTWHPPTSNGKPSEMISAGVYRWTRGGILGRDFGGSEIDTGQR